MVIKTLLKLSIFLFASHLFAGTNGSISGTIKDKEAGDSLRGVNVFVERTPLGASTGIDGQFVINNVPPGSYII